MGITAPPAETAWLLSRVVGYTGMGQDDITAILEEATKTAEGVLAPLDVAGDRIGARWNAGQVTLPDGFVEGFRAYADGGWIGIAADPAHGGQGLDEVIALAAFEPVSSANMGFGLCPLLTQDAIKVISVHGSADQRARFLRPMIEGRCTGTMCLTEPQSGSDLSGVRTAAHPNGDGTYAITGQKIYITYGEHALTGDFLLLVLARLPGAPAGSAGISLFAVPKRRADGSANGVSCLSIEHKLGIHASPTCVMGFDAAQGTLVGAEHRGLTNMFAMMNAARLGVAMQGVAVAERAFRRASSFAAERSQGGAAIINHPDVRRMLWTMRALALGGRLLTLYAANCAEPRASLLIPVAKSWCTDAGFEAASIGVQVHGGMGFIEDTGAAQHLRDARIAPIYEGTNGIQALTLLRRGLLRDQGAAVAALLDDIADDAPLLIPAVDIARAASDTVRQADARVAEAGATAYLGIIGTLTAGWLCARVLAEADAPAAARSAASVYLDQIMPRVAMHAATITATPCLIGLGAIA
jgi:alkylation response protein AidB-like acyl-CoA dehydrogenase